MIETGTHWQRERVHAAEECLRTERERALRDIVLLMRRHGISTDERVELLENTAKPEFSWQSSE